MRCTEFLEHYSDFRDAQFANPDLARQMRRHLLACPRCMQYDARVSRGVTVFKTLSDLEPSTDFRRSLTRRLLSEPLAEPEPVMPASAGLTVALMVATGVALVVWDRSASSTEPLPSSAASEIPVPAVVANAGIPFVSFTDLSVPAFGGGWRTPGAIDEPLVSHTAIAP